MDQANAVARESPGCEGLSFEVGSIAGWSRGQGVSHKLEAGEGEGNGKGKVDILVALHACDTATDDGLFYGMKAGADVILVSPCCHKEVRVPLPPLPLLLAFLPPLYPPSSLLRLPPLRCLLHLIRLPPL